MKISELITQLEQLKYEYGDLPIHIETAEYDIFETSRVAIAARVKPDRWDFDFKREGKRIVFTSPDRV